MRLSRRDEEAVYPVGTVNDEAALRVPIASPDGSVQGDPVLGPRRDGLAYSERDRKAVDEVCALAAQALRLSG